MPAKETAGEFCDVSKGPLRPPPPITVNPAEFLALRAIV